jgi:hypothetical protein
MLIDDVEPFARLCERPNAAIVGDADKDDPKQQAEPVPDKEFIKI